MKLSVVAIAFAVCIALSNALPVPEESSAISKSSEDTKTPSVSFDFHLFSIFPAVFRQGFEVFSNIICPI